MIIRLPGRFWFKPRAYGFGARPCTWEGWTFTAAYAAGVVLFAKVAFAGPMAPEAPRLVLFLVGTLVLTFVYAIFAWLKTDGRWRWRWGAPPGQGDVKIVLTREDLDRRR